MIGDLLPIALSGRFHRRIYAKPTTFLPHLHDLKTSARSNSPAGISIERLDECIVSRLSRTTEAHCHIAMLSLLQESDLT
jgi:hypothetical protein